MLSNTDLAQILRRPEPWTSVEMLESELRELAYWLIDFVVIPESTADDVEKIIEDAIAILEQT